jgi:dCMP deaminase
MERIDKTNYYLDIAETVLKRSTCIRRQFGAVVVKNDEIVSTGYNGSPRGRKNCSDIGFCIRNKLNIPRGERYELCRSVHAEQNAIISASRKDLLGSTIYLACHDATTNLVDGNVEPCSMCRRFIINAGVSQVVIRRNANEYKTIQVDDWINNDESLEGINEYGKLN